MNRPSAVLFLLIAAATWALPALAQPPDWTLSFDMDQPPPIGGWMSTDTRHEVKDGILRIVDASSAAGSGQCFQIGWQADPAQEAVVEARMQVVSAQGDAGVCIWVSNGVNEEGVQFHTDGIDFAFAKLKFALDTTADFHVYRVTFKGQDLKLYVDDKLALDATGKITAPAHQGRNQLTFGSASSAAQGESLWDYVRFKSPMELQRATPPPGMEQVTIFREPDTYAVFPSLRLDPATGRLATSFRAGGRKSHIDAQGASSVSMVSDDGGRTWQKGPMLPGKPFAGPNGRQVRVWCKWWQERPAEQRAELEKQGYAVHNVRPGTVAFCAGAMCALSDDGGKTWTNHEIEYPFMACLASGMNSLQLSDGTILFPTYGSVKAGDKDSSWLLRSTDYGATWQFIQVGLKPEINLNEPEIIECKSGRLLMVMRTGEGTDHLWQATSDDKGATWHDLKDTGVQGHPPDLLRLQDGRILLSYGFRHPGAGIRAAVSSDEGETWDLQHIWALRSDGGGTDLGYPHSVQLADGTVVTVYYFFEPGGMQYIAGTRWRVPQP
jgi:sialidase-1